MRLTGDDPSAPVAFHLDATIDNAGTLPTVIWPATREADSLASERQVIRTPRGGTPGGGVAIARALGAPPEAELSDFTLVSDVHFEQISGPSALTVRFRYAIEAGGGSGYLLTLDAFAGEAYLDTFDEGIRRPLAAHTRLPVELGDAAPRRLTLQAAGPDITAALDGQEILHVKRRPLSARADRGGCDYVVRSSGRHV